MEASLEAAMKCSQCSTSIPSGAIRCPACATLIDPAARRPYLLYALAVFLAVGCAVVVLFAFSGVAPSPQTGMGLTLWAAALGYYRARRQGTNRARSTAAGAALGVATFVAASVVAGMAS